MASNGFSLTRFNDRAAESVKQDQIARMCGLILLYTLPKINLCSRRLGLKIEDNLVLDTLGASHESFCHHSIFKSEFGA